MGKLCIWNKKKMLIFVLYYNFFFSIISTCISLSRGLLLVSDIIILICFAYSNGKLSLNVIEENNCLYKYILVLLIFYFADGIIGSARPLLFVWSCRNYLRFYLFMVCCINIFRQKDIQRICNNIFLIIAAFNPLFILFQRFVLGITNSDMIGGIFGSDAGCNAMLNLFSAISFAYVCVMSNKISGIIGRKRYIYYVMMISVNFILATVFAEIKVLVFELVLIILCVVLLSGGISRKIRWIALGAVVGYFLLMLLALVFPDSVQFVLDPEKVIWYNSEIGYGEENAINRLSAFDDIQNKVFSENTIQSILGVGIGNASKINFLGVESNIYHKFYRLRYDWFTHSMIYIEQGYIGLILYVALIVGVIIYSIRIRGKIDDRCRAWYDFGIIVAVLSLFNMIYNNAMIMDTGGYLCYFCLAIPFIESKERYINKKDIY